MSHRKHGKHRNIQAEHGTDCTFFFYQELDNAAEGHSVMGVTRDL